MKQPAPVLLRIVRSAGGNLPTHFDPLATELSALRARVLDVLDAEVAKGGVPDSMKGVMLYCTQNLRELSSWAPYLPPIDFLFTVIEQFDPGLAERELLPLCASAVAYYLGVHLFDDVMDGELDSSLVKHGLEPICLTSALLSSALPRMIVNWHYPRCADAMSGCFQDAAYRMLIGQHMDRQAGAGWSLAQCEHTIREKTGAMGYLLGKLAGHVLGANHIVLSEVAEALQELYIASQLMDDVHDIWVKPVSPDLAVGAKNIAVVFLHDSLPSDERTKFLAELDACKQNPAAQASMRERITQAGGLHFSLALSQLYKRKAFGRLERARGSTRAPSSLCYLDHVVGFEPVLPHLVQPVVTT
jgi:geranylgeranyl pyrophosphate synthase